MKRAVCVALFLTFLLVVAVVLVSFASVVADHVQFSSEEIHDGVDWSSGYGREIFGEDWPRNLSVVGCFSCFLCC